MAGGDAIDESQFKGLSKYFNSYTFRGRVNTARATLGGVFLCILYFKFRPSKKATVTSN